MWSLKHPDAEVFMFCVSATGGDSDAAHGLVWSWDWALPARRHELSYGAQQEVLATAGRGCIRESEGEGLVYSDEIVTAIDFDEHVVSKFLTDLSPPPYALRPS